MKKRGKVFTLRSESGRLPPNPGARGVYMSRKELERKRNDRKQTGTETKRTQQKKKKKRNERERKDSKKGKKKKRTRKEPKRNKTKVKQTKPTQTTNQLGVCNFTKLCWIGKHKKYDHETDKLSNPRPTQPKKKLRLKSGIRATFFLQANVFSWAGIDFILGNRPHETQPDQNPPQTP